MKQFIWTEPKALDSDFCKHCIQKFEECPDLQFEGETTGGRLNDIKKSTDLFTTRHTKWAEEQKVFHDAITKGIDRYRARLGGHFAGLFTPMVFESEIVTTGYQIQRTKPGEYYHWHNDSLTLSTHHRMLTYIFYLNTLKGEGGETEFYDGTKIRPVEGKLLIFPATWTFYHRGVSPVSETKYIATGWVCNFPLDVNGKKVMNPTPDPDQEQHINYSALLQNEDSPFFLRDRG